MPNGRCRLHGGTSTGAKTPEGKERQRAANLTAGGRETRAKRETRRGLRRELRRLRLEVDVLIAPYLKKKNATTKTISIKRRAP